MGRVSLSCYNILSGLFKMSHYTVIIVECKPYVVYVTLACILYLALKKGYKAVEYSAVAEYK